MHHSGHLDIRFGPMFASKTKWLNGKLTDYANKGLAVAKIVNPDDSNRTNVKYSGEIGSTHHINCKTLSDEVKIFSLNDLTKTDIDFSKFDVVGIDEAQFFIGLYDFVLNLVDVLKKRVLITGLDGNSDRKIFGDILYLIPISDSAKKLPATCDYCLDELKLAGFERNIELINAPFTKRLTLNTEEKFVGGKNDFRPICRYHYLNS